MTFVDSGNLLTDKQTINDSFEWNTQTEWEAFQSKTNIQIVSGVVKLADFLPSDIASLVHWYDATEITANDGDSISTWADQEGTDDLTQGTASKQPTYQTNVIGGNPIVRFDGADDVLEGTFANLSTPNHIFVVAVNRTTGGAETEYVLDGSTGNENAILEIDGNWAIFAGVLLTGSAEDTDNHIFTGLFDGVDSVLRVDGSQDASGDAGTNTLTGLTLGGKGDNTNFADFDIGEVLVYDASLSTADRNDVESYLSDKWGITI